ncbi:uncharacterized protein FOMMEDRAFT_28519 [Fomitiporia mediterranea MF3/22]|uniref:uncharacterized protein n=1 Tax=Fomitiporia mediterranea (strain MF3/22) TaxID=694068 RepID=UPI0004409493|nr:uncharacterized protein FOMMEDRAFT_28519 [Fomitiporia mediterranea MF3/22]EJD02871.1 hypothetical protein FOMMEDRAFT_28519 [Fomitiporia mediterranea MF3/22]
MSAAEHMTPEAKARRFAAIDDAVEDLSKDEGDRGNFNREESTTDDEYTTPDAKRTRFSVKKEGEEGNPRPGTTSTPPRRSRSSVTLPTPVQTSEREGTTASQGVFSGELPPSPTSFTKGAQRAMDRARAQSSASGSGLQAGKGKAPATTNDEANVEPRTEETNASIPGPSSNEPNGQQEHDGPDDVQMQEQEQGREESFPSQLASTIQRSAADMQTVASNLRNRNSRASPGTHSAAATTIFNSMSTISAQQTSLYSAVHDLLAESERLRRRVNTAERNLAYKDTQIARLQEENAELKTRNTELEAVREQIHTIAKLTPPRSGTTTQD